MVSDAFATVAPDWVCEGLSPSTEKLDRLRKLPIYAKEGLPHVWLMDTKLRRLEVFGLVERHYELAQMFLDGDTIHAQPFEVLELSFDKIMDLPNRASEGTAAYGR